MKKFVSLFITVILVLALLVPATVFAEGPEVPEWATKANLIAGQNITIGCVYVWNDTVNLYVKYEIAVEGWCLDETHLAVATSLEGIPQTHSGNPPPGQFPYMHENLNCVKSDLYTIPLDEFDVECEGSLFVAAHAVVCNESTSNKCETAWGAGEDFTGANWATYFNYAVQCEFEKPKIMNAYIGYEDWPNGDFDYNDFGMYFSAVEYYWGTSSHMDLTKVVMTFEAVVYDSGMDHLIHIKRPIFGDSMVTVTSGSDYGSETPAGTYSFTGDVDVVLFDTAKYAWPSKQIGETVTVEIVLLDPSLNPEVTPTTPRWDLDAFMANYDPWETGTRYGSLYHIGDMQLVTSTTGSDARLIGETLPYILVVPSVAWIPPYENTTITGPYNYFYDYYHSNGGSHTSWYTEITNNSVSPGGLSW